MYLDKLFRALIAIPDIWLTLVEGKGVTTRAFLEWSVNTWKVPGNCSAFLSSFRTMGAGKQNVANILDT